uniref:Peptidase S1 domain-containing protein n=1 Tax=Glossina brevipalpis TaxID=37001 RepID=A0A1A9WC60_9MUSC
MQIKNEKFKKSLILIELVAILANFGHCYTYNIPGIQQRCNNGQGLGLCVPYNQCRTKKSSIYFYRDECEEINGILQICCSKDQMRETNQTVSEMPLNITTLIRTSQINIGANNITSCPLHYKNTVNSSTVTLREYPFMYALGWQTKNDNITIKYNCGVALVSPNFALTAAHCFYDEEGSPTLLRAGGPNPSDASALSIKISKHIEHPNYTHPAAYNDVALIKLVKPLISDHSFACLWTENHIEDHSDVILLGYEQSSFPHISPEHLMKIDLKIRPQDDCGRDHPPDKISGTLENGILNTQICAIDTTKFRLTCPEDSGGPLMKLVRNELYTVPYIIGITSIGVGCASSIPGIYTRISEYIPWLQSIIELDSEPLA